VTRSYIDDANEDGQIVLPADVYNVEIIDARTNRTKNDNGDMLFMTLAVLDGPDKGKGTDISLFMPDEGAANAQAIRMFTKKARALLPVMKKVNGKADDDEFAEALAEALVGHRFTCRLGIQEDGPFKGNQELQETKPLDDAIAEVKAEAKTKKAKAKPAVEEAAVEEPEGDDDDDDDDEDDDAPF